MAQENKQYTLWQILGIWLAAGLPMWVLDPMVYPTLSDGRTQVESAYVRLVQMA